VLKRWTSAPRLIRSTEAIARFAEATKPQIRSLPDAAPRRRGRFDVRAASTSGLHIVTLSIFHNQRKRQQPSWPLE
jgi:hypothetical protein